MQGWLLALLVGSLVVGQQAAPRRQLLDVASRVSSARVAPGERFSVTLDLTPAAGIHVYAPGVTGYKPIGFTVKPQPGVIVGDVSYPASEKYYYAPLKETVAVYQRPFSVVQQVTLDATPAGRAALKGASAITLQGTLSYQACDDRICYPPRTVPLSWTVPIKER
jgi:thioredoxin:protein disulfide reductase